MRSYISASRLQYFLDGNRLKSVEEEKDLGVIVDEKLNSHSHIAEATAKANKILGCIRRSIKFKNEEIILPLYKAHVRSRLEYGSRRSFGTPIRHKTELGLSEFREGRPRWSRD